MPIAQKLPELDLINTVIAYLIVIAAGTGGLFVLPIGMSEGTIMMMVLPSMVLYGAIMVAIGIGYGKHLIDRSGTT